MSVTYTQGNRILGFNFGGTTQYVNSPLYIGLSKTTPTQQGGNITEPTIGVGAYARIEVDNNVPANWATPASGVTSNAIELTFPESTTEWAASSAPITHIFISDSPTSLAEANILYFGALNNSRAIPVNTTVYFTVGSLVISIA